MNGIMTVYTSMYKCTLWIWCWCVILMWRRWILEGVCLSCILVSVHHDMVWIAFFIIYDQRLISVFMMPCLLTKSVLMLWCCNRGDLDVFSLIVNGHVMYGYDLLWILSVNGFYRSSDRSVMLLFVVYRLIMFV